MCPWLIVMLQWISLVRRTSLSNLPKSLLYCSWVHPLTSHFIRHTILVPLSAKIWLQEFKLLKMTCWIIIVICHFYEWKTLIVINIIFIRDQTKRREEIAINDARRQRCKAEKKKQKMPAKQVISLFYIKPLHKFCSLHF